MSQQPQETGITPSRLEQLCQPGQIEDTLRLLFALNHWAKARERLFFADRQGLYLVKAAIVRQAYLTGLIQARAYIDGREEFGADLSFDLAADIAAESFLWRLAEIADRFEREQAERQEDTCDRLVHQLYTRITGRECLSLNEVETLEIAYVHEYILRRLGELEHQARTSGRPIPHGELSKLCIAPTDLLSIQGRRCYDLGDWQSWQRLDASDLRKLDPEGLSLVTFDYTSLTAHYVFHLPFRVAEAFVPDNQIILLKKTPRAGRESGEYYGRPITEEESLQQPIADILRELGADIATLCPHRLCEKEAAFQARPRYATLWDDEEDNKDEEEYEDYEESQQRVTDRRKIIRATGCVREPGACPLCAQQVVLLPDLARAEHWQEEHPGQDLTISQARWVLNCSLETQVFCRQYPPDYRASHERGWGTRYWKLATLKTWLIGQTVQVASSGKDELEKRENACR